MQNKKNLYHKTFLSLVDLTFLWKNRLLGSIESVKWSQHFFIITIFIYLPITGRKLLSTLAQHTFKRTEIHTLTHTHKIKSNRNGSNNLRFVKWIYIFREERYSPKQMTWHLRGVYRERWLLTTVKYYFCVIKSDN